LSRNKNKTQRIRVPAVMVGILFCYILQKRTLINKDMATNYMTAEGYKKLVEELNELERVQRPAISKQIGEARDKGDLSENAEYDAAKEAQGMLEMRISNLKEMVSSARMIDESKINTKEVQILTRVKIKNTKTEQIMTYMIVSESEANFKEGKLSVTTPIAKGLLGKKVGQKATVSVPSGEMEFEVMEISL
jgi:transcription elongation factor GreA